jgi:hypothetical protein
MRYLISTTETYRLNSEEEVKTFIEELKKDPNFEIKKYSSTKKEAKQKGEIVDEWIRFTVTKEFNIEKEPYDEITITYEKN